MKKKGRKCMLSNENNSQTTNTEIPHMDLSEEQVRHFCKRLSGTDMNGSPVSTLAYYLTTIEDVEKGLIPNVHTLSKGTVHLCPTQGHPEWYTMDVEFRTGDDAELRLLWGNLQQFLHSEKEQIFFMSLIKNDTVLEDTGYVFRMDVINPVLFYLTKSSHEAIGDNMIRMLIDANAMQFSSLQDDAFMEEKAHVLREAEQQALAESENFDDFYTELYRQNGNE